MYNSVPIVETPRSGAGMEPRYIGFKGENDMLQPVSFFLFF
jgi:hypothetical protein